jgi:hypothetical protein
MSDDAYIGAEAMYRALGHFFVEFSQLLHAMESTTAFYLAGGRHPRFVQAVLSGREAKPIIDGYFALCIEVGNEHWSDDDRQSMRAFRKEIVSLMEDRNRFAHETWFVGWTQTTSDGSSSPAPDEKYRTVPRKSGVEYEWLPVTVKELDQRAADADRLRRLVGNVLGLIQVHAAERGGGDPGGVRRIGDDSPGATPPISDLLKIRDGRMQWATWEA